MSGRYTHVARGWCAACVCAFVLACDHAGAPAERPVVRFRTDTGTAFGDVEAFPVSRSTLAALGASDAAETWQRILAVHVGDTSGLPMLGRYTVSGDTVRFRPRFRPSAGATYVARYASPGDTTAGIVVATWRYTDDDAPSSTIVQAVYPSTDVVPMNLLRMYVEFSAPMSTGRSYEHVKLYAEEDSLLEEPFFTAGGTVELWDPTKTRLTILFDPGRIKRDLKPNVERGLPLREGRRYRLVIDSAWRDARGQPLRRGHEKRFRVSRVDRSVVRTADWQTKVPKAGTRDTLTLRFPKPLDHALLARMLTVRDAAGVPLPGDVAIGDGETRWSFIPGAAWGSGQYSVDVDTELEDLAGNNLRRQFDVMPGDRASLGVDSARVRVPFVPRP